MKRILLFVISLCYLTVGKAQCPNVTVSFSTSANSFCGSGSHAFSATNTSTGANSGTATYQWYIDGTLITTTVGLNPPLPFNVSTIGNHTFKVTVTVGGCSDSMTSTLTVSPLPDANFSGLSTSVCVGSPSLVLVPIVSGGVFNGAGIGGYAFNPAVAGLGLHSIQYSITDVNGCSNSIIQNTNVLPIPTSNFTFNPDNECAKTNIIFTSTSTDTSSFTTYHWDFGDGTTSNAKNTNHQYNSGGNYTVTLTISNGTGCTNSYSSIVVVKDIPQDLGAFGDEPTKCLLPGDPTNTHLVNFSNNTTNAVGYSWDFGDGSPISTLSNPSHNYTTYGTFQAIMTATASNGCSIHDTIQIVFDRFVSASMTLNPTDYSGCTPLSLSSLTNTSVNANTYTWDFGDGTPSITTSNLTPPFHQYQQQGNFTISLTASNNCNTAFATIGPIIVVGKPKTNFSISNNIIGANGCAPAKYNFTNNTTGTAPSNAYQWNMGNGNTYTNVITPPTQSYDTAGVYTISLTASNACGDSTFKRTITIDTIPIAKIHIEPNNEGCSPLTVSLNSISEGNIAYYHWYQNGSGIIYSTNDSIGPLTYNYPPGNTPVTQTFQLTVGNSCGSTSDNVIITIHRPTLANFNAAPNQVCVGSPITFTNNSLGEGLTYEWQFGDGSSSTTSGPHTINYMAPGTYQVKLIAKGFCGNDTLIKTVTVYPFPIANFNPSVLSGCQNLSVSFTNNSTSSATQSWNFGGGSPNVSSNYDPGVISYSTPGNKQIILTVTENGCVNKDTSYITVFPKPIPQFTLTPNIGCSPLNVNFNNTSSNNPLDTYYWDFGNGNDTSTYLPDSQMYVANNNDSTYAITLYITTSNGCEDSITKTILVHPTPIADFIPDILEGCKIMDFTFTNNSSINFNYNWNFGVGATPMNSNSFNPGNVNYSSSGVKEIVLMVDKNGCSDADTNYITVYPQPTVDFSLTPSSGCSELTVVITNNSTNTGSEIYDWDLGGTSFSGFSPSPQLYSAITNDTTYNIKLVVSSGLGCEDSLTKPVTVHAIPLADFSINKDTICLNEAAQFINNSTLSMAYSWDFADGSTSTLFSPTHQFMNPGNYDVTLIVNSPFSCSDTVTFPIVVNPNPTADFSASTACLGYETIFADSSMGNITTWNWNLGDGTTTNTQNPTHTYASAGSFNTNLEVINNFGCSDNVSKVVNVNTIPIADFTVNDSCTGQILGFTNQTTGSVTGFEWDFGDGSPISNQINATHTFMSSGSYLVKLIAYGGSGCSDTITKTINIYPIPQSDFILQNACMNDTIHLIDNSMGNPDTFNWDFGNGIVDNTNNPSPNITYNTSGSYTITLVTSYSNTGCKDTIKHIVNVHPRTTPQFSSSFSCLHDSTSFTDETIGAPTQWYWDFGDGTTGGIQNPNHYYNNDGNYIATLITENVYGCSDTIVNNVVVKPLPTPGFVFDTVCLNSTTSFTDVTLGAISWSYNFGDGSTSFSSSPQHLFGASGTYTVQQTVTNNVGCSDSITRDIIVRPNPTALFVADTSCFSYPTTFTNQSLNAINSTWDFSDNGEVSNLDSPNYTFSQSGVFSSKLIVTNIYGCQDSIIKDVKVLPQPNAGFLNNVACARQTVNFTDTSLGTPTNFNWSFGDGTSSSIQNPTHAYTIGGNYNVTLIVSNNSGCFDTLNKQIVVFSVPNVNFSSDTTCFMTATQFIDLSSDVVPISSWNWNFGDGNTSVNQNPSYIYMNPGTYNVSLTVINDNGCDSTISHPVVINLVPNADFNFSTGCFGTPTIFTDNSTNNPGIFVWDFGDGTIINGTANEQHTYSTPGSFVVRLMVYGNDSICGTFKEKVITIPSGATADFAIPVKICVNTPFNFYDNSTIGSGTITDYQWEMGDGTIYHVNNGTHAYTSPGVYQITENITTSAGCQATMTKSIEVLPATVADFEWSGICVNSPILFTNTSSGGTTNWFWNFGDGTTSQTQFPTHNYLNANHYNVSLIVQSLSGCSDTIVKNVEIAPAPKLDFTANQVCFGDPTTFVNNSMIESGNIASYLWDFGESGGTSSQLNPIYTFTSYQQNHSVQLVAVSDLGCKDTLNKTISLLPIINFDISFEDQYGCAPLSLTFENNSSISNGTALNYSWDFQDGTNSFQQSPTHTFQQEGIYPVSVTVETTDGCSITKSDNLIITVYPSPTASFNVNPNLLTMSEPTVKITDESINALQWEYDLGDGSYSNLPNLTHDYNDVRTYVIIQYVKNEYGCVDSTQRAIRVQEELTLFVPNTFTPNGDRFNQTFKPVFTSGYDILNYRLLIFDRWGEIIFESHNAEVGWDGTYKGKMVQDGTYVWKISYKTEDSEDPITKVGHVNLLK